LHHIEAGEMDLAVEAMVAHIQSGWNDLRADYATRTAAQ